MADVKLEVLRKEIKDILKDADLRETSSKKVRLLLEEKLKCDLIERKKEIDQLIMDYVNANGKDKKNKKNDDSADTGSESGSGSEESDEESDNKKSKKRAAAAKSGSASKKAKKSESSGGDDNKSDDESGEESSDDKGKRARPPPTRKPAVRNAGGRKKKNSDSDSDTDWKAAKKPRAKKVPGEAGVVKPKKANGFTRSFTLTPELSAIMGTDQSPRHEVVKKMWALIKERNLYDKKNRQYAICDAELHKVMGVKRFRIFGMMKYLKDHFRD